MRFKTVMLAVPLSLFCVALKNCFAQAIALTSGGRFDESTSLMLLGTGMLGMVAVLRRRLHPVRA